MPKLDEVIRSKISIPKYFKDYIDPKVDLDDTPKACCPFHDEDTPSFSYSSEKGVWRCFGKCKTGGDVISMHQKHQGLITRQDAVESLKRLLHIQEGEFSLESRKGKADEQKVNYIVKLNVANNMCRTPEDWVELDHIMSQYQTDLEVTEALEQFISNKKGGL